MPDPQPPSPPELLAPTPVIQNFWCSAKISKKLEDTICQYIIGNLQKRALISEYVFYVSTTGGDPYAGVNLFNFLKSLPIKTTGYNMGIIASAGVPFFLGFKSRFGTPNCNFMVHQTSVNRDQLSQNVNAFDLQTQLQLLSAIDKKTVGIIRSETIANAKTKLSISKIEEAIEKSKAFSADDALKYGFIEGIEQPEIPGENILYLTDEWLAKN